jgi:hypothetical protein
MSSMETVGVLGVGAGWVIGGIGVIGFGAGIGTGLNTVGEEEAILLDDLPTVIASGFVVVAGST